MKQTMLGLRAETQIHAGTGQNSGVIDMPIQREAHTGYPCVFGSAVKGAFRAHAEILCKGQVDVLKVFGSADADGNASQIAMTDARLLLLPVRSLTGHFKLVTCPAILKRLKRDMAMMGITADWQVSAPNEQQVLGYGDCELFLEEFKFTQSNEGDLSAIIDVIENFGVENLAHQLLIMADEEFAWFAKNATAVTPHIAINSEAKIVKGGALWYEETLPSDTVLYTMIMGKKHFVNDVVAMFTDRPYVQIGGNETVGMGWCKVREVSHA